MIVKLMTEHHLKGGGTGSSESTYVKMPYCWKSHALAHLSFDCESQLLVGQDGPKLTTVLSNSVVGRIKPAKIYDLSGDRTLGATIGVYRSRIT